MAKEDAARERSASIAQRTSGRMITYKKQELSNANRSTSATSSSDGLASRLGSKDAFILSNMARLGVVNPQIAQLSYVLQAITSTGMLATVAVVGTAGAIVALGNASVKAAAELQQYQVTLQGLATHGWNEADKNAQSAMDLGESVSSGMIQYATESIYAFDKIAAGTEKLVGYGIDMRVVNDEMKMLGNLALGDSKRLENLAVAYGQVFGQGKARAQEMYQFVNAGIPIFDALAKSLGKTTADIMDMTRKGEISFNMIRDILRDLTSEGGRYNELMQKIANMSFNGQFTMFMNNMKVILADLGNNILPLITNALSDANEAILNMRQGASLSDMVMTSQSEERRSGKGLAVYDRYSKDAIQDAYDKLTAKKNMTSLVQDQDRLLKGEQPQGSLATTFKALMSAMQKQYLIPDVNTTAAQRASASKAGTLLPFSPNLLASPYQVTSASATSGSGSAQVEEMKQRAIWLDGQTRSINALMTFMSKTLGISEKEIASMRELLKPVSYSVESSIGTAALGRSVSPNEEFYSGPTEDFMRAINNVLMSQDRTAMPQAERQTLDDLRLWLEKNKGKVTGSGQQAEDADPGPGPGKVKERQFLLDEYNKALGEQILNLREISLVQRENNKIEEMKFKDRADIGTKGENDYQEGMSEERARVAEKFARTLFLTKEAYDKVSTAAEAYYGFERRNAAFTEQEIADAATNLKLMIKGVAVTEEYRQALAEMTTAFAAVGMSEGNMLDFADSLYAALDIPQQNISKIGILGDNFANFEKVIKSTTPEALKLAEAIAKIGKAFGDDAASGVAGSITELRKALTETRGSLPDPFSATTHALDARTYALSQVDRVDYRDDPLYQASRKASRKAMAGDLGLGNESELYSGGSLQQYAGLTEKLKQILDLSESLNDVQAEGRESTGELDKRKEELSGLVSEYIKLKNAVEEAAGAVEAIQAAWKNAADSTLAGRKAFQDMQDAVMNNPEASPRDRIQAINENRRNTWDGMGAWSEERKAADLERKSKLAVSVGQWFTGEALQPNGYMTNDDRMDGINQQTKKVTDIRDAMDKSKENGIEISPEQLSSLAQATEELTALKDAALDAGDAGKVLGEAWKSIKTLAIDTMLQGATDAFYEMGKSVDQGSDAYDKYALIVANMGKTMLNQLPGILMSAASGVLMTSGGANWPLALALVGAALGTSFIGGLVGSKEKDGGDEGDLQMKLLQNLQDQFQTMIQQFEQNILYLDTMRTKYISDTQIGLVQRYAKGDTFAGSTGLDQGIYTQPTFFKFASGASFSGVMGEAGPEAVMPLKRGADGKLGVAGAGGATTVIVNNYADASVTTKESTGENGEKQITLMVEKLVSGMAQSGKLDGAMSYRYGVTPQATRRS